MVWYLVSVSRSESFPPSALPTPIDRPFNPWRSAATDAARAVVKDVLGQLGRYEEIFGLRQRARRPADLASLRATVQALVCDLAHLHLSGGRLGLGITRSNRVLGRRSRYRPPSLNKRLPAILDILSSPELEFVVQEKGFEDPFGKNQQTRIRPGARLVSRIDEIGMALRDLALDDAREVIWLKRAKADFWDDGDVIEYGDTPETNRFREEVRAINRALHGADIQLTTRAEEGKSVADVGDRAMRRVFTQGRFDCGGRLFGGFWQSLSKDDRARAIRIGAETVVELDFGQMNPRICYGLARTPAPPGDLYSVPDLADYRDGVKTVMNAMLFATKRLTRKPKDTGADLPPDWSIEEVMRAIEHHHPALADYFFAGQGHHIQFIESQILVAVLLTLLSEGIIVLPIHDSILVPLSKTSTAHDVMGKVFRERTGSDASIKVVQ